MRHLARWTLNAVTIVSLLLCVVATLAWASSYTFPCRTTVQAPRGPWIIEFHRGSLGASNPVSFVVMTDAPPPRGEAPFSGSGPRPLPSVPIPVQIERLRLKVPLG